MTARFSFVPAAQEDLLAIRRFGVKYWGLAQAAEYLHYCKSTIQGILVIAVLHQSTAPLTYY
jgi:plasmid stabilization system protein ParE